VLQTISDLTTNSDLDYDNHSFQTKDLPALIGLMQQRSYLLDEEDAIWRSSIHAVEIISRIGDLDSLPAMIAEMSAANSDESYFIIEELPEAIQRFGTPALDLLFDHFDKIKLTSDFGDLDSEMTTLARTMILTALGDKHAEIRVIESLKALFSLHPESETISCIASELLDIKRVETFEAIKTLFKGNEEGSVPFLGTLLEIKCECGVATADEIERWNEERAKKEAEIKRFRANTFYNLRQQRAHEEQLRITKQVQRKTKIKSKNKRKQAKKSKKQNRRK